MLRIWERRGMVISAVMCSGRRTYFLGCGELKLEREGAVRRKVSCSKSLSNTITRIPPLTE
jgi:hypothetical protein